jgi:peptidoglycan lytic transglycosylase
MAYQSISAVSSGANFGPENVKERGHHLRRVLTHSVYALLLLGGSMGAAPGHLTLAPQSTPAFLPIPDQQANNGLAGDQSAQKPIEQKQAGKPYQVGQASWYGELFQGKATASGEEFDMYQFTAAHRELPLGSYVRVTNLSNHRSVVVKVNDRGPVTPGRIIDLSYSAARSLNMHNHGLQKVRLDLIQADKAELAMAKQPVIRNR